MREVRAVGRVENESIVREKMEVVAKSRSSEKIIKKRENRRKR